jgi:hypothetical protein
MTARHEILALAARLAIPFEAANTLRRAEKVLHRWGEQECGDGNDYASWAIERDETTGKPYRCWYPHTGAMSRTPIADREAGALRRVRQVCAAHGLHYHHQTDPRGRALYVSREAMTGTSYTNGVACCA